MSLSDDLTMLDIILKAHPSEFGEDTVPVKWLKKDSETAYYAVPLKVIGATPLRFIRLRVRSLVIVSL